MVVDHPPEEIGENVGQISNGPSDQLRELVPIGPASQFLSLPPHHVNKATHTFYGWPHRT